MFSCRNSEEQKNKNSAKSDETADHNSEADEYGGSTDEELKEEQSTGTCHPSSKGQIIADQILIIPKYTNVILQELQGEYDKLQIHVMWLSRTLLRF